MASCVTGAGRETGPVCCVTVFWMSTWQVLWPLEGRSGSFQGEENLGEWEVFPWFSSTNFCKLLCICISWIAVDICSWNICIIYIDIQIYFFFSVWFSSRFQMLRHVFTGSRDGAPRCSACAAATCGARCVGGRLAKSTGASLGDMGRWESGEAMGWIGYCNSCRDDIGWWVV